MDAKHQNQNQTQGSYAAAAASTPDNQPEGTVVDQPPPYTVAGPSAPGPAPAQPNPPPHPDTKRAPAPQPPHAQQHFYVQQGQLQPAHPEQWRTPRQLEAGEMVVLVAHSPEYYAALARARTRFWGTVMWALLIYFFAVMLVGGGVEDAYRNSNRHAGEGHKHKHEAGEWAAA